MTFNVKVLIGVVVVIVIAIGAYKVFSVPSYGGVTNYDEVDATAIKIGGSNGTRIGPIIAGTSAFVGMNASQAASSTVTYDFPVTGVVSGDYVQVTLATTSQNSSVLNWSIRGCVASSTSGFVTCGITNFSGAAAVPSATQVGSSTNYLVIHPVSSVPGL